MIVALARKVLIVLCRIVTTGAVPADVWRGRRAGGWFCAAGNNFPGDQLEELPENDDWYPVGKPLEICPEGIGNKLH
jgi:hypothetical protein